jgi:hypothetical protein
MAYAYNPSYSWSTDQEDHWRQPRQIVRETLSWKNPSQKRAGEVTQDVGPEFKPQYYKKKKRKKKTSKLTYIFLCLCHHHKKNTPVQLWIKDNERHMELTSIQLISADSLADPHTCRQKQHLLLCAIKFLYFCHYFPIADWYNHCIYLKERIFLKQKAYISKYTVIHEKHWIKYKILARPKYN